MSEKPRIAVLGGGIGGLATAAFLHREGLSATVYEQAPQLGEVGAGLVVAPNAARQLRKLGVLNEFRNRGVQLEVGWRGNERVDPRPVDHGDGAVRDAAEAAR